MFAGAWQTARVTLRGRQSSGAPLPHRASVTAHSGPSWPCPAGASSRWRRQKSRQRAAPPGASAQQACNVCVGHDGGVEQAPRKLSWTAGREGGEAPVPLDVCVGSSRSAKEDRGSCAPSCREAQHSQLAGAHAAAVFTLPAYQPLQQAFPLAVRRRQLLARRPQSLLLHKPGGCGGREGLLNACAACLESMHKLGVAGQQGRLPQAAPKAAQGSPVGPGHHFLVVRVVHLSCRILGWWLRQRLQGRPCSGVGVS